MGTKKMNEELGRESPHCLSMFEAIEQEARQIPATFVSEADDEAFRKETKKLLVLGLPCGAACNLRCKFCFTYEQRRAGIELSIEERLALIDEAAALGVGAIITGGSGEPFCESRFFELLERARSIGMQYNVFSNLTLINSLSAQKLFKLGIGIFGSCHSLNEKCFEDLTQVKGSFQKMLRGADYLLDAGYTGNNLAICCVVNKKNFQQLAEIISFWAERGIKVYLEYGNITGLGKAYQDELYLPFADYSALCKQLEGSFPGFKGRPPLVTDERKCFTGEYAVVVGIDGSITRCYDPGPTGVLGNIRQISLREAVQCKRSNSCFCPSFDACPGRNLFLKQLAPLITISQRGKLHAD